jgi:hypothetical protein
VLSHLGRHYWKMTSSKRMESIPNAGATSLVLKHNKSLGPTFLTRGIDHPFKHTSFLGKTGTEWALMWCYDLFRKLICMCGVCLSNSPALKAWSILRPGSDTETLRSDTKYCPSHMLYAARAANYQGYTNPCSSWLEKSNTSDEPFKNQQHHQCPDTFMLAIILADSARFLGY